ncbi:MAG TPA: OmpW family outer membrane protein [Thermoanaerobaculia bacterium]
MKLAVSAVLFSFLMVVPAFGQSRAFDLTGAVVWVDPDSQGTFDNFDGDVADIEFDGTMGYGLAANIFWGDRISTEFAISRIDTETTLRRRAVGNAGADLEMMPITGVLQFHFIPNGVIDPYVGAGVGYVLFDQFEDRDDLDDIDFERIEFEDDYGFVINAGLGIRISPRLGITLDAKYIPLESSARAVFVTGPDTETTVDINPVIVSAGLTLRF